MPEAARNERRAPDAPAKDAKPAAQAGASPRRARKWIVIGASAALLLGAGGGAWWWLSHSAGTAEAAAKPATPKPPVFMNLEPFTVNLADEGGEHYLQMAVTYQVADDKTAETMKTYLPVIRNRILLLLSAKKPSELASAEGKAKLADELTAAVRDSVPGTTADKGIVQAYLGAFVIQ